VPRIVADTNIYISALNFAGTADEVLALGRAGLIEICISPALLDEIGRPPSDGLGQPQRAGPRHLTPPVSVRV